MQRLDHRSSRPGRRRFLALVDAGKLDGVRQEIDRTGLGVYPHADALIVLGKLEEALQVLSNAKPDDTSTAGGDSGPQLDALRAVVYARLGRRDDAERVLAVAMPAAANPSGLSHMHHAQFHIGAAPGWLGRREEAVRWLNKAADEGYPSFPRYSTDPSACCASTPVSRRC